MTTRQDVRFHGAVLKDVPTAIKAVEDAALTTREACSHTVRNVTACAFAGVSGGAPFDSTPYAELTTRFFLRAPLGSGLPRTFKMAVSGCESDCAEGAINDLGLVAQMRDGASLRLRERRLVELVAPDTGGTASRAALAGKRASRVRKFSATFNGE